MKLLHTADWHIGTFRSPVKDGINLRIKYIKSCLDELVRVARKEQPDYCLISGDVFHVGRLWSDRCCDEIITAIHYIKELAAVSKRVIVMRGTPNHDGAGQFNVLAEMFADCKNVHIVNTVQILSFDDVDIAVLPGFDKGTFRAKFAELSNEEENKALTQELSNIVLGLKAQCNSNKQSILMAHYTVPGCNTESGQTMFLTQFEPVLPMEMLQAAAFDLVALGHIHRPQAVPNIANCYYSGAINAMNFNDEGQERGFWIHQIYPSGVGQSIFYHTPIREFITLHFTDTDIIAINQGHMEEVAVNHWRYNNAIQNKIVRIHYTCSLDNAKAYKMNEALLEKTLLEDGALMLWENLPERIEEVANKTELVHTTNPEENLIEYLKEKEFPPERIEELVLKARPIIAQAQANMTAAVGMGVFEPIEISVKNYRNYEEETFNFENITFCTINGQNGAGKSSLFMDAIIDCLFEEPREGFIKDDTKKSPWLRNDEKVRSGYIQFTFRIGDKKYRVTRTRERSGKGTLNISQFINEYWKDCSKEKFNDTQQEVIHILGMDSFTLKSCALIMQNQYGLFLEAKPEERIEVLSTLLGLGIYPMMEKIATEKEKINSTKSRELKEKQEIHHATIEHLGNPDEELKVCKMELAGYESNLQLKIAERDKQKLLLANQQEAAERRIKLLKEIAALQSKKAIAEQNKATQQAILDSSLVILDNKPEIEEKVKKYNEQVEKEKILLSESTLYSSKKAETQNFKKQAEIEQKSIDSMKEQVQQKEIKLSTLQPTEQDTIIKEKAAEYELQKKLLDEAYEKERAYRAIEKKLTEKKYTLQQISLTYETDVKSMQLAEDSLKKKAELLLNVDCVDINNAKCGFLSDAILSKQLLEDYPKQYAEKKKRYEEEIAPVNAEIEVLKKQLADMNFDMGAVTEISIKVNQLKPYVAQLEMFNQRESQIALIKAHLENLQSNILEAKERLAMVKTKGTEAEQECDNYAKAFEEHVLVQNTIQRLKPYLEKEKQLPVAEERKATAMGRILELTTEISSIDVEIAEKQTEVDKEIIAINGMEELTGVVVKMNADVETFSALVKQQQIKLGALQEKLEQIEKLKKEIATLQEQKTEYTKKVVDFEILKVAFSKSGVPHQIIRSIIPQLTTTSNTILGQMTGGKMSVEFQLERLQKSGKEKVSLDIFIEEHGKGRLPYLSKSGGEKVKASLSVILALAEIKSSSAGIQLGMLFIDEPPFLDGDGIQAYCDALETIQNRYSNIKIMAITHDYTMKARFPQNIDVVKTVNGSKVIY